MKITQTKNVMGTINFEMRFHGMLKPQDFIVYPLRAGADPRTLIVQSDTRMGRINLFDGLVTMSQPHSRGATFISLLRDKPVFTMLSKEDCATLRDAVKATAGADVGLSFVKSDNTGAFAL